VPDVYGLRDGLLYREWLPEEHRLSDERAAAAPIAAYVAARNGALAVAEDTSTRLVGSGAVWEQVAELLGSGFGRARLVVRPLTMRASRRLLAVTRPSIVDGSMAVRHWFEADGGGAPVKVDFHQRAF